MIARSWRQAGRLEPRKLNGDAMIKCFGSALAPFAPTAYISRDKNKTPIDLEDSLQFVIQPPGRGHRARNVSAAVFEAQAEYH